MYIKILIQDVYDGIISTFVGMELSNILQKHGLNVHAYDDLGDILEYTDIDNYRYLLVRASDMKNRCRKIVETDEEKKDIQDYIYKMGFETVEELPLQDII